METDTQNKNNQDRKGIRWTHILLLMLVMMIITIGITVWVVKSYIFPSEFTPVTLSTKEERILDAKLEKLDSFQAGKAGKQIERKTGQGQALEPEAYSEKGANRNISLSEKEVNSLLAKNTDLARKLAIDLSDDLVSAKLLVPVDEDFPIMGGQILKVRAGVEIAYRNSKPIVVIKGVSIMGVPLPNAWIGGIKNIDLVREFGGQEGFWKSFSDGVENINVKDGQLNIKLKE
jgi:flagellar basal body-associated protein FliL